MILITHLNGKTGTASTIYEGDGHLTDNDVSAVCQHITARHKIPYGLIRVSGYEMESRPHNAITLMKNGYTSHVEKIFDSVDDAKKALKKKHFAAREYRIFDSHKYWDAVGYFIAPLAPLDEDFPEDEWVAAWENECIETDEKESVYLYVDN